VQLTFTPKSIAEVRTFQVSVQRFHGPRLSSRGPQLLPPLPYRCRPRHGRSASGNRDRKRRRRELFSTRCSRGVHTPSECACGRLRSVVAGGCEVGGGLDEPGIESDRYITRGRGLTE
jgi:hypothetical protein